MLRFGLAIIVLPDSATIGHPHEEDRKDGECRKVGMFATSKLPFSPFALIVEFADMDDVLPWHVPSLLGVLG